MPAAFRGKTLAVLMLAIAVAALTLTALGGGLAYGSGEFGEVLVSAPDAPEVWCPCTERYVPRIEDCPDCRIDGLDVTRNPTIVTVRGTTVQGQIDAVVGSDTSELYFTFVWNTGDTLRVTGGYAMELSGANANRASWSQNAQRPFQGRVNGRGQGNTTFVIRLRDTATRQVVYVSPPIRVVVRQP